jgi:hypothetical protein
MPHILIQFRRDSAINWSSKNTLLASGELGIELDTQQFKIGDGHTRWISLPYGGLRGPQGPAGLSPPPPTSVGQVLTSGPDINTIGWQMPSRNPTNTAIIKVAKSAVNFNFQGAVTIIPPTFGNPLSYAPLNGTTDTSGFSIILNSNYTMLNFPMILGTIAYWDNSSQKMIYLQIKFGNSNTTNSVRATIIPVTPITAGTYGAPLTLHVEGISASSLTGVGNVSNTSPLNYAVIISLNLIN